MNPRCTSLKAALLIGLLCLFALGRVAYAAHQCYALGGAGCGGGVEHALNGSHQEPQSDGKVCAQAMEAPDGRGGAGALAHAGFAIAPLTALAFVPAPGFQAPFPVHRAPPPTHVHLLNSLGRRRL